jgi:hypothetical protein
LIAMSGLAITACDTIVGFDELERVADEAGTTEARDGGSTPSLDGGGDAEVTKKRAAISGALTYRAGSVPAMHVVAFLRDGSRFFETRTNADPRGAPVPYRIEVEPGTFYVAAYAAPEATGLDRKWTQAYSDWSACAGDVACQSSAAIEHFVASIHVGAGEEVARIDPNDNAKLVPAEPELGKPFGCGVFADKAQCVAAGSRDTENSVLMWCQSGLLRAQDCDAFPPVGQMRCGFSSSLGGMNCVAR